MIFERAADQVHAVGQQRRGQGVAREALDRPAVEAEAQRLGAVDAAAARGAHARSCAAALGAAMAGCGSPALVGGQEMIGGGVAQRIEEPAAAARMPPAFGVHALGVAAHVQEIASTSRSSIRRGRRAHQVRLAAVGEFDFGPLAAVGTEDEQHGRSQWATAAAAASSIR